MTNSKDERGRQKSTDEEPQGSSDHIKGQSRSHGSGEEDSSDEEGVDEPLTIEENLKLSVDKPEEEEISESKSPGPPIESAKSWTNSPLHIGVTREDKQTLSITFSPSEEVTARTGSISELNLSVSRLSEAAVDADETEVNIRPKKLNVTERELTVTRQKESLMVESTPSTILSEIKVSSKGVILDEVEELDPVFGWTGGHPYGIDRPRMILHISGKPFSSFDFLQRCLRDTYAEIRGGEPKVNHVEFVANEPQIPTVSEKIVTLDLTDGDWSPSQTEGRPKIERGGTNVLPTLADTVQDLYSGGLGYFVVNLPEEWEGEFRRSRFFMRVVEHLTDGVTPEVEEAEDSGALEKLRAAPVTVARPRISERSAFNARVSQYYGFEHNPDWETIAQADAAFMDVIRSERWSQVALTERQFDNEESSRHYNWKGLITEGIARHLHEVKTNREIAFTTFMERELLDNGPISTEKSFETGTSEQNQIVADIHVNQEGDWVTEAMEEFTRDEDCNLPACIEFETGFSEGGFQYRKVRESIEKYDDTGEVDSVLLVIPPRLLYRGERQARLLNRLVESDEDQISSSLHIPTISGGKCSGLRDAERVIDKLYGDGKDD